MALLSIPALNSQTDKVENIKSIGNPEENPKNNILNVFFSNKIKEFLFFNSLSPKRR